MIPERLLPKAPPSGDGKPPTAKLKEKLADTPQSIGRVVSRVKHFLFLAIFLFVVFIAGSIWWVQSREVHFRPDLTPLYGKEIPIEGGIMFVQTDGEHTNPPLVFVHGAYAWSEIWKPTMQTIVKDDWYTVALDMPPFGFSSRPVQNSYTRVDQVKRLEEVFAEIDLTEQIVLIAHADGARAVMEYTYLHPEQVAGVVLVSPALGGIYNDFETQPIPWYTKAYEYPLVRFGLTAALQNNPFLTKYVLQQQMYERGAATDEIVAVYQEPLELLETTIDYGVWKYNYLTNVDAGETTKRTSLEEITVPVAIIWGDKDDVAPYWQSFELQKYLPNAEVFTISNVGHLPHIEDKVRFMKALREALVMIESGGGSAEE